MYYPNPYSDDPEYPMYFQFEDEEYLDEEFYEGDDEFLDEDDEEAYLDEEEYFDDDFYSDDLEDY